MSAPGVARRATGRLSTAVVGLLGAAVALWGSSRLTWVTAVWDTPARGRTEAAAAGAATTSVLGPWALLALAGIAGLLATTGWGRRVVGAVLALGGLAAVVRAAAGFVPGALPPPAQRPGRLLAESAGVVGPLLALLGGLLMLGVGALAVVLAPSWPRLGARYDAPGSRRRPSDPDQQLWEALDEGRDPTADRGRG